MSNGVYGDDAEGSLRRRRLDWIRFHRITTGAVNYRLDTTRLVGPETYIRQGEAIRVYFWRLHVWRKRHADNELVRT